VSDDIKVALIDEDALKEYAPNAGDKEVVEAFIKDTERNMKRVVEYAKETRSKFRELEDSVKALSNMVQTLQGQLSQSHKQTAALQQKLYGSGPTAG
jgi:septal ring factor EnvC (AmiA/AmiB activator)